MCEGGGGGGGAGGSQGDGGKAAAGIWSRACRQGVAHKLYLCLGGPGQLGVQLTEATKALEIIQANGSWYR